MKACILIKTTPGTQGEVFEAVEQLPGVKLAFPVFGRTDIIATVEVPSFQDLVKVIEKAKEQTGVTASETLVEMEAIR